MSTEPSSPLVTDPSPPIRLCCMTRHAGPVCPDGTVWCCMCFDKVSETDVWQDANGVKWDVCKPCGEHAAPTTSAPSPAEPS